MRAPIFVVVGLLASCSNYEVNTTERWCENLLSDENLAEKHAPFWAVLPGVSFNGEAIRDDFVRLVNNSMMEQVQGRTARMAWRDGTTLHIENLSSLMEIDPNEVINGWRSGIELYNKGKLTDPADQCLYGTVTSIFNSVVVHTEEWDTMGLKVVSEDETVLDTERTKRIKNPL